MKAGVAMDQATDTAITYFRRLAAEVDRRYPKASANARLSAAVELSKVAATDFHTAVSSGNACANLPEHMACSCLG